MKTILYRFHKLDYECCLMETEDGHQPKEGYDYFVAKEDYDELVKEHDANVLMLKAFQELFKQVEPEVARLRNALDLIARPFDGSDGDIDYTDRAIRSQEIAWHALNHKPNLNDNPESEEESW